MNAHRYPDEVAGKGGWGTRNLDRMLELTDRPRLGPYILTRELDPCALASRSLAVHHVDQSSHLLYRFAACREKVTQRRFMQAVEQVAVLDHVHLLPVEEFAFDIALRPWLVTPFPGSAGELPTLAKLLRDKGGQLSPDEAEHAVVQVLEAVEAAHEAGVRHGPIKLDEVIVDRRGSLLIELYGLERALHGLGSGDGELVRDEVRSVVEMGYQLITGLRAEEPLIPADRLVKKLDRHWAQWLHDGLDPLSGFDTAGAAMEALPSRRRAAEAKMPKVTVRSVLGRLRPAGR